MNYSIILLGATISVSLFIRICGVCSALEVNSRKPLLSEDLRIWPSLKHHDDIAYNEFLHDPLHKIADPSQLQIEDKTSEKFTNTEYMKNIDLHQPTIPLNFDFNTNVVEAIPDPKNNFIDPSYMHGDLCGNNGHIWKDTWQDTEFPEVLKEGEAPEGCRFTDVEQKKLTCEDMDEVPPLPSVLKSFELTRGRFEVLRGSEFGDVTITDLVLRQNSLSAVSPYAFSRVKNVSTLQIVNNELEYLPYALYAGLNETKLLILDGNRISLEIYQSCEIKNVSEIDLVLPKLNYFSLKGNPLKIVPSQMWAGLRESPLTALVLSSCYLEHIYPESFQYLPNLKNLQLDENPELMTNLTTVFQGLINIKLETLGLANNNLRKIPWGALSVVGDSLTTLNLSSNQFGRIETGSFPPQGLPKLRELYLSNCRINFIGPGTLELLPNLIRIDLSYNRLYTIPPPVASLSRLMYLSLDNNAPREEVGNPNPEFLIEPNFFVNLTFLSILTIGNTPVKRIRQDDFTGLINLQYLLLSDAKIEEIDDLSFRDLRGLRTLYLSNNDIATVSSLTFYGLAKLEILYMHQCGLTFPVPPVPATNSSDLKALTENVLSPFVHLNNLLALELPNNNIQHIFPELFFGLDKLRTLDLSKNEIRSWTTPIFTVDFSLTRTEPSSGSNFIEKKLLMSKNKIDFITDAIMQDLIAFSPEEIDLAENPMICDEGSCSLRDLMRNDSEKFHFHSAVTVDWSNKTSYKCVNAITGETHQIYSITDEICLSSKAEIVPNVSADSTPTNMIIGIVSIVCGTCFFAGMMIVGYKKRVHLKYMFFVAKFNVKDNIPRKAKTSVAEDSLFQYDLFVSYHNQDRDFLIDEFLPEVEDTASNKNESSDFSSVIKHPNQPGFRVCLHERDFEAGVPILDNIVASVDSSKKIVILVSKKYLESQWCTYEMNFAYQRLIEARRNSFVLILLEAIPGDMRTKVLNYLMHSRTYLEWPGANAAPHDKFRFWKRLRVALSSSE